MKKAIVIGASSGIGFALTQILVNEGYKVGITARREKLLEELNSEYSNQIIKSAFDVTKANNSSKLSELVTQLGGLDLLVLTAGTGELNQNLDYDKEDSTNKINVTAFTEIMVWAYHYFEKQQKGHIAVISSIAGIRGSDIAPSYNASKGYQINYLEGLRKKTAKSNLKINITDVRPGFVDTAMAKGEGLFWVASKEKAANQIYKAIKKQKQVVYVTKRWKMIAVLLKFLPKWMYYKV